jgi:hypothetical protein
MAANFKISPHRSHGELQLELIGDFDGTSACQLLNTLGESCGFSKVLIDTKRLRKIYPFGIDTFQKNLYRLKDRDLFLVFRGNQAPRIAPEVNGCFPVIVRKE